MCTVSYIPKTIDSNFVLTSNRDEDSRRPTIAPMIYDFEKVKLAYPKDEVSGGSWIAMNNKDKVNCLLNGGIGTHTKQEYHTVSRGTILIDLTKSDLATEDFFQNYDLHNVEPFTIISIQLENWKAVCLTEVIWDGNRKHFRNYEVNHPHIWSSAQLYSEEQKRLRQKWFTDFIKENESNQTLDKIANFHNGNHSEDVGVNVIMQRGDVLKTVSITQITCQDKRLKMSYADLLRESKAEVIL